MSTSMNTRFGISLLLGLLLLSSTALAHIGTTEVYCEGDAGPYHILVTVRPPKVIPGLAEVEVLVTSGSVHSIKLIPILTTGQDNSLPPTVDEVMDQVAADKNSFVGQVWLMTAGSWKLETEVDGDQGKHSFAVPVPAYAQTTVPMQKPLALFLLGFMVFLALAAISIVGASVGQSLVPAGAAPSSGDIRRGRNAMVVAALLVISTLSLGGLWWRRQASRAENKVYTPPELRASLEQGSRLNLQVGRNSIFIHPDEVWSMGMMPDHGHLMHLFLLRTPDMDRFYHLHPEPQPDGSFSMTLPPLNAGHYRVFADIVRRSGFPETMTTMIDLPDIAGQPVTGDDSSSDAAAFHAPVQNTTVTASLPDGSRMVWERDSTSSSIAKLTMFRFHVEDSTGKPVSDLEPYMGMMGHAEFVNSDQSVFAHVHPAGSVSMAALELMQPNSGGTMQHGAHDMNAMPAMVSFPFGFPKPGSYRLFVQIKRHGQVETGVFDTQVM